MHTAPQTPAADRSDSAEHLNSVAAWKGLLASPTPLFFVEECGTA